VKRRGGCALLAVCTILASVAWQEARAQTLDELYALAVKARQEQRFDEAAELLKRALVLKPDNADALVQLGFTELGRGELSAARQAFSKALSLAPNYADAKFGLAQIEFRSGNLDAAQTLVEPLTREQPQNGEFAALLASIHEARETEEKSVKAAPVTSQSGTRQKDGKVTARPRPPQSDPVAVLLDRGREQRSAGQLAEAEQSYRQALKIAPRNTDVLVALGLVSGAQQKFDQAAAFLDAVLAIQPANVDARLGQVRLAIWHGDVRRARALLDETPGLASDNVEGQLLDARLSFLERDYQRAEGLFEEIASQEPKNAEALVGLGDVRRARGDDAGARETYEEALLLEPGLRDIADRLAVPPPRKWRLDIGSEISELSDGRGNWTDSSVGLSYKVTPDTTLGGRLRTATRYGQTDLQLEARIDQVFSPSLSGYALVAATPDADFLARFSAGAGVSWQALPETNAFGPVFFNLDARYDQFDASEIVTVSPWVQGYVLDGRVGLSARWVHAEDDGGARADGYVLRTDVALAPRLTVFAGYADAPEISDATLVSTSTVFGGAAFDVNEELTLRGSFAHEQRPTFDRNTFGLGLTARF
jgi:YaiO family outer membrane protein